MSLQVGAWCYADAAAAAAATCSQHVPVSTVQGGNVMVLSCTGVTESGALIMQTSMTAAGSADAPTLASYELAASYAPCTHGDYVTAGFAILAAVLSVFAITYGPYYLYRMLTFNARSSHE